MSSYNVKVFHYFNGKSQFRIYNRCQSHSDDEADIRDKEYIDELRERVKKYKDDDDKEINEERSAYVSKNRTIQEIYNITRSNNWEWFITLTFNPEKVDSFDYDEIVKKLTNWLNNIKKRLAPDLKYIIVPELHKSGRYHFHGLMSDTGNIKFSDSGKIDFDGAKIYNIDSYNLGFTTASKIKDVAKACSYVSKYITKELFIMTKGKKRYWHSKNLNVADVEEMLLSADELQELKNNLSELTTYTKSKSIEYLDTTVQYWEIDYNLKNNT